MKKSSHANGRTELIPAADRFDYSQVASSVRGQLQAETIAIRRLVAEAANTVVQVGLRLQLVHEVLGRDRFQTWLKSEFEWSPATASKFMRVAKVFRHIDCVNRFQPTALYILSRHKVPDAARTEALSRARRGETITHRDAECIVHSHLNGFARPQRSSRTEPGSAMASLEHHLQSLAPTALEACCSELEKMIARFRERSGIVAPP